ncbi:MAG TPA: R2-like ligand-binding oxidase [Candidatus Dormibacteraeota bacterium]|nr:R2-like ligand-binding oxidase [Candidatus Dormibacteraeota bacterium]
MAATIQRQGYQTTSARGLRFDSVPMRLFQKAKKLGTWDPADIDFTQDRVDWARLSDVERDFFLRDIALFQAGEEAVTVDLLPLIMAIARGGHVEEEIYLTSFLWEEAKHVEFFRRWLDEVPRVDYDLHKYVTPSYRKLFFEDLPAAMNRLVDDDSREALAEASVTYNMVIEGMLAETGYYGFRKNIEANGLLPGMLSGIKLTARDESRHIRYGVYLLNRLVSEDDAIWDVIKRRMNELFPTALAVLPEFYEAYDEDNPPFGTTLTEFVLVASDLFDRRMKVLERDRGKRLEEIERAVIADMAADDAVADPLDQLLELTATAG